MTVHAKLELDSTTLVWPPAARGRSELQNGSEQLLANLNSGQIGASPALLVRSASGGVNRFAELQPPGTAPRLCDVEPGDGHTTRLSLGHRVELPGPGDYEFASEYRWDGGEQRSAPVAVRVLPARPGALQCESVAGGRGGDVWVAWRNDMRDPTGGVWLARLTTTARARFVQNVRLGACPPDAFLQLSVPVPGPPGRQCVVWRRGDQLEFAIHAQGQVRCDHTELSEGGRLFGPVLEDPATSDPERRGFEMLWVCPNSTGWELHLIPIAIDRPRQPPTTVPGPPPVNVLTTYDRNGGRMTWFLRIVTGSRGQALTELSGSAWPMGVTPRLPTMLGRWPGRVVTASIAQRPDDTVYGVALIHEPEPVPRMVVHRWWSGAAGFEELDTVELGWPVDDPIEYGVLRVAQDGRWYALVRAARGVWGWCEDGQPGQILPAGYADVNAPVDIVFVDGTVPALVYTRPRCGLRVHLMGEPACRRAPG